MDLWNTSNNSFFAVQCFFKFSQRNLDIPASSIPGCPGLKLNNSWCHLCDENDDRPGFELFLIMAYHWTENIQSRDYA